MEEKYKALALASIQYVEFDKYWKFSVENLKKSKVKPPAWVYKKAVEEYYNDVLADEHKELFAEYFHIHLYNFLNQLKESNLIDDLHPEYENYKQYLKEVRSDKYWKARNNKEFNNTVFKTDLNEQFFNYVVNHFEQVNNLNQRTFHFLYYVLMESLMLNGQKEYVGYVNKNYNQTLKKATAKVNLTKTVDAQLKRLSTLNEALKQFNKTHQKVELNTRNMLP